MEQAPKPKAQAVKAVSLVDAMKDNSAPENPEFAELRKQNEELQSKIAELLRVIEVLQKGKSMPKEKLPRPAGKYRLTSAMWNGRKRIEPGTEKFFEEGDAPQSARLLEAKASEAEGDED